MNETIRTGKKILGIIPARSGSKGIRNKNIMKIAGKPLISYTIGAALNSRIIDKLIVSTDSYEYADIAKRYGAEVPFIRPKAISRDKSTSIEVLHHTLNWLKKNDQIFDYVYYLQPTSPLRRSIDIINSYKLLCSKDADSIIGVCISDENPLIMNNLPSNLSMKNFLNPNLQNINRQKLKKFYKINGAIYLLKVNYIINSDKWISDNSYAYIMPKERSVDIDSEIDILKMRYYLSKERR